ncbi:MAG TPA: AEC family transporter [Polyangiales bacterium]|nr:AEC family transporter [Polyangiales bacterium]
MASALLLVFGLLALGYALARTGVFVYADADAFNRYVVYVCLPALVLLLVPKLTWEPGLLVLVVAPWLMMSIAVACVLVAARIFAWPREVIGALLLCVPLGNTSFIGFPIVAALRGPGALRYAVLYDQFGSFLMLSTYGLIVLARFSGEAAPTPRAIALRVLKFPPFVALVLALLPLPRPALLNDVLQRIGDTLVPVAVLAVGLRLKLRAPPERSALTLGLAIKMGLCPLIAFALSIGLHMRDLPAQVAIMEAAMPPMITAGAMASMAGLAPELCAALVGYGVVIAFVSVPLLAALL